MYTATIQVALNDDHTGQQLRLHGPRAGRDSRSKFPDVRTFFQSGSMVDAILNMGMPAPIDVQVNTRDLAHHLQHRAGPGAPHSRAAGRRRRSTFRRT